MKNDLRKYIFNLKGHSHSHGGVDHSHGHSHGGSEEAVNIRAALVHIVGDLVQSVGVLLAGLIVKFYPGTRDKAVLADPICTLGTDKEFNN